VEFETDKTFYTETMARLLTQQGRYDRAAEVYRYLWEQSPHRKDLGQALEQVLSCIPQGAEKRDVLSGLIKRWVTLMLRAKALRQLQNLSLDDVQDDGHVE
jgi:hypothetical protein